MNKKYNKRAKRSMFVFLLMLLIQNITFSQSFNEIFIKEKDNLSFSVENKDSLFNKMQRINVECLDVVSDVREKDGIVYCKAIYDFKYSSNDTLFIAYIDLQNVVLVIIPDEYLGLFFVRFINENINVLIRLNFKEIEDVLQLVKNNEWLCYRNITCGNLRESSKYILDIDINNIINRLSLCLNDKENTSKDFTDLPKPSHNTFVKILYKLFMEE